MLISNLISTSGSSAFKLFIKNSTFSTSYIFGDDSINAELELLQTVIDSYKKLGLKNLVVKINDRKILTALVLHSGFSQTLNPLQPHRLKLN